MDGAPAPLLYSFRRCPYAMRARMALLQAGRAFDVQEIVLRDKPAALLAASSKGTVPVLVLPGGEVLEQSLDIMRWAFAGRDSEGWWARAQSAANLDLLARCDGPFKQELDRYKYPERHADAKHAPYRAQHRAQAVQALLQALDACLQHTPQLGGSVPCAADLAIFPFVRQFAAVEPAWFAQLPLPALQAWLAGWLCHPLLEAAMVRLAPGQVLRFPLPSAPRTGPAMVRAAQH